jgi:hypothetical protein
VLLLSYLVPQLHEAGFKPKIEKRGHKVMSIGTKVGVVFRDITKLLAPSTNLREFGRLFGLEQSKAHFPFSVLTSVGSLSLASLPAEDSPDWKSDLSGGSAPSVPEIREAHALFCKSGCRNLGEYLLTYLKLDVQILFEAAQQWRLRLKTEIGIDFIEARKFTISSLSYLAGIKTSLESKARVGHFFPNNSQHYRLLRAGMRGCVHFFSPANSPPTPKDLQTKKIFFLNVGKGEEGGFLGEKIMHEQGPLLGFSLVRRSRMSPAKRL